jgi:hypothetical protein
MDKSKIEIGKCYFYFPSKQDELDNRHFPARVESIKRRVEVTLFMEGFKDGVNRWVCAEQLDDQFTLFG